MRHFKNIIIGFGKAGKTLAGSLTSHGEEVLLIEKDPMMYGGTCINIACLPTKNLVINSQRGVKYEEAFETKEAMTAKLRNKNYHKVADQDLATVLDATAEFLDDKTIKVTDESGTEELTFDRLFINTGAESNVPNIDGLKIDDKIFTSTEMLAKKELAKNLVILGGGPIGLEFASMYAGFGSKVTVIEPMPSILGRFEPEIAQAAKADMEADGVTFMLKSSLTKVEETEAGLNLTVETEDGVKDLQADVMLVSVGRHPATAALHLEKTSLEVGQRGEIVVNDKLETSVPNIYAMGDVAGCLQFTYISLDDWRIVDNQLFGDKTRTKKNRPVFANSIFIKPAISSAGLTESELKAQGKAYKVLTMPAAGVPKAQVIGNPRGAYKALIDPETHEILGATIYAEEAYETINVITLAMQNHLKAEDLRDQIYAHPTMTEALNDLFKF
ncbi:FAD-dependent oxidoreductase [Ligilactobacillus salivarius]|uniref:FAD-dependent oxidoreductase n=1 Tax=Ligilactobacillus salivarius TaxID=1624 RepID=UPI0009DAA3F5|nr:FAD-dependent oxidoreductase [Ligilactobacillus salivarius]OQR18742.1 pyridine nucleotide-disulfide oxidoreductase [Ligilactobacillus salivarius]